MGVSTYVQVICTYMYGLVYIVLVSSCSATNFYRAIGLVSNKRVLITH